MERTRVRAVIYDCTTGPVPGFDINCSLGRLKVVTRHGSWYTDFTRGGKDYFAAGREGLCDEAGGLLTALGAKVIFLPRVIRERG